MYAHRCTVSLQKVYFFCLVHWEIYEIAQWTNWGRVTHICVSKIINMGSDNGVSPGRHQVIIWSNARMLLIGPLGTNLDDILFEIR